MVHFSYFTVGFYSWNLRSFIIVLLHLKEIPLIGTDFWMCCIPNESCAFEASVTE